MRPIIHSRKHYVQVTSSLLQEAALSSNLIAQAIEGAPSSPTDVEEGASVKAVFVEMWVQSLSASAVGSFTAIIVKNPGGVNAPTGTDMAALHDWDNKKNILYTTQGLTPTTDSGVLNLYKGFIKIPKGKQRMGLGDKLQMFIRNNDAVNDLQLCGFFTFKEYT